MPEMPNLILLTKGGIMTTLFRKDVNMGAGRLARNGPIRRPFPTGRAAGSSWKAQKSILILK
ncbi:MAG: hypothetical protein CO090_04760 [Acidobacteria bacterium CG_4_9_14_3_um_filter_49_7]|nr:MAG: hypothetical protein CO090_04760 [Acidobacteria bacterium CG_4_9_14_3_um_filter_49_7]